MVEEKVKKNTKEEGIKENSNYLRGTIKEELKKETSAFNETDSKILKFHGVYQQDNRDTRQERITKKLEKEYYFMIRTKLPGGQLTPDQYLGLNTICDGYSNKTLRITTRQTIQFHGVIKDNLQKTLNEINKNLILTYGACGDVVRNVITCPVCDIDKEYSIDLYKIAKKISDHLLPASKAYYEIWVDDEKVDLNENQEPIYGKVYLPRKFKIGIALENDNCIDVYSHDVGIVAIRSQKLIGFNILIGGGLGHTHNKPETYPRLASPLCFVEEEKLIEVLAAIVTIQRDFGGRSDRKHARLKYLIDDKGLEWFKNELEKRIGYKLSPYREIKSPEVHDHVGWHKQNNNLWYLGLFIENGRIVDNDKRKTKTALKEITEEFKVNIRLTAEQNIILTDIKEEDIEKINKIIIKYNLYTVENLSELRRNSMACPALPTCGLALAEAERFLPSVIDELEKLGFKEEALTLRISGCPNSCSRPPLAELGVIGVSANKYNIYVGGDSKGTRLNKLFKENVSGEELVLEIAKLFTAYKMNRLKNEHFGDFCIRTGLKV